MRIGYQGIEGSNSEEASYIYSEKISNIEIEYIPLVNSKNVVKALVDKEIDIGIMAIYNTIGGDVEETINAIKNTNLEKVAEIKLQIHHCLFKKKNISINSIKKVASHIQALNQTKNNINRIIEDVELIEVEDTALAAKKLAEGELDENIAVVCKKKAGEIYGLELVKENVEDNENNITTFEVYKLI